MSKTLYLSRPSAKCIRVRHFQNGGSILRRTNKQLDL
ncbi:uncharacterized protein J3R85_012130 [Psidium guajava]|nr:uncharacterized protein J3R85_012130 [Psidium guajava]